MIGLIKRVLNYNKTERIERLCVLGVKQELKSITMSEMIELEMIQHIREQNGEIDEVKKNRNEN